MPTAPFTAERIRCEIKKLIAAVTERDPEEISDTASFKDDLGVDSLMAMEVMVSLDKLFNIDIPEEEFTQANNVEEAVIMVQRRFPEARLLSAAS
jgi:acyl carrier protein